DVCDPGAENFAGDHVAKIPLHRGTGGAHRSRCSHHNEPAIWHADATNEQRSPFSEQRSARSNSRDGEVTVATRVGRISEPSLIFRHPRRLSFPLIGYRCNFGRPAPVAYSGANHSAKVSQL